MSLRFIAFSLLLFAGLTHSIQAIEADVSTDLNRSVPEEPMTLFSAGDAGYACFRIPAIVK